MKKKIAHFWAFLNCFIKLILFLCVKNVQKIVYIGYVIINNIIVQNDIPMRQSIGDLMIITIMDTI